MKTMEQMALLALLAVGCGGVTAATVPMDGGAGSSGAGVVSGTAGAAGTADGAAAKVGSGAAGTGGAAGSSAGTAGTTGAGNTTGAGGTSPDCPRSGQMLCGGQCTSVFTDPDNCGACNRPCSAGQSCTNGACTGSGVGGSSGAGNTTGTGNTTGAGNSTGGGNSTGSGNASGAGGSTACTGGAVACNGTCVNANASDAQNCGGCGARCPSGSKCNLGKCWDMAGGQRTLVTWPACPLNGSTRTSSSCNLMTSDGAHSCGLCVSGYDTSATPCLGSLLCVSSCGVCP